MFYSFLIPAFNLVGRPELKSQLCHFIHDFPELVFTGHRRMSGLCSDRGLKDESGMATTFKAL